MLKKFLAGLTAIALSLGMVALTAAPASATYPSVSATKFECSSATSGTITWKVTDTWNEDGIVVSSTGNIVPQDTLIAAGSTTTYTQVVSGPGTYSLNVKVFYPGRNYVGERTGSITLKTSDFTNCDPNETQKVEICHANNGNGWVAQSVSVNSIIKPNGHAEHQNKRDIIPPFSYDGGSFAGLNWDTYGQWVDGNGCSNTVTAAKPATSQAVCTASGQVGGAGYTIVAVTGVRFERSDNGTSGWTEVTPGFVPMADGTSVWVRAVALSGYTLSGNANQYKWRLDFTDVDASKCVTPVAPTPTYAQCTAPGQSNPASYRIPFTTGVQYQRYTGSSWVNVGTTNSNTDVPVTAFPTTVQLRAVAKNGYTIVGGTSPWTFAFTSAGPCLTDVTPATPTFTDSVCNPTTTGVTQGGYLIPTTANVSYTVSLNGAAPVSATTGSFVATNPGDVVVVTAIAATGYQLAGYTGPWTRTFANPGTCLDEVTPVTPAPTPSQCTVPGQSSPASYLVTAVTGVRYEAAPTATGPWTTVSGSVPATAGSTVWVRAVAETGYRLAAGYDGPWKLQFTDPGDCITKVTPVAPTFSPAVCTPQRPGAYGTASYTIPSTAGVKYEVKVGNGPWTEKAANTYTVAADADVRVRAVALPGYSLQGDSTWRERFKAPDCLTDVTPSEPTWAQAYCTGDEKVAPATFVIPEVTGVKYQQLVGWTWVDRAAGPHPTTDGDFLALRAVALPGYETVGHSEWWYWIPNIDASKDCIVPDAPTFDPQVCTEPGDPSQATFTIPAESGVRYQVKDGATWKNIADGTYDVDDFPTTVEVRAVPKFGYHFLDGATTSWSFDFTSAGDCIQDVEVGAVTKVDQTCVVEGDIDRGGKFGAAVRSETVSYVKGWITIPNTPGVDYFIDGDPYGAGDWEFDPGTYTVTAVAQPGYALVGYDGPWKLTITKAPWCGQLPEFGIVDPLVTFQQTTCTVAGRYTLAVDPAEESAGVVWTVSGGKPNTIGTHVVTTPGTLNITAVPAAGYGFTGSTGMREWSFDFATLPDDCLPTLSLPTLAVTGGAPAAGALGLGALLTLGGVLLVVARRREKVSPE